MIFAVLILRMRSHYQSCEFVETGRNKPTDTASHYRNPLCLRMVLLTYASVQPTSTAMSAPLMPCLCPSMITARLRMACALRLSVFGVWCAICSPPKAACSLLISSPCRQRAMGWPALSGEDGTYTSDALGRVACESLIAASRPIASAIVRMVAGIDMPLKMPAHHRHARHKAHEIANRRQSAKLCNFAAVQNELQSDFALLL